MKVIIDPRHKPLAELVQERNKLQEDLMHLDADIQARLQKSVAEGYRPLHSDALGKSIDEHRGNLSISDLVAFAGVSLQTYYNAIQRVDVVSVGKLNKLLGAVGLQLFIGKRQDNN
jgi:hypothetical protein